MVRVFLLLLVLAASVPSTAFAQETDEEKAVLIEHLRAGRIAFENRQWAESRRHLKEAHRITGNDKFLFRIAQTYENEGKKKEALETYVLFSSLVQDSKAHADALAKIDKLEQQLRPKVMIESEPRGARVEFEGKYLGKTPFLARFAPGEHTLKLTNDGYQETYHTFETQQGEILSLKVVLEEAKPVVPTVAVRERPEPEGETVWPEAAYWTFGASSAFAVLSVVSFVLYGLNEAEIGRIEDSPTDYTRSEAERVSSTRNLWLTVGISTAIVSVAGFGVTWYLVSDGQTEVAIGGRF